MTAVETQMTTSERHALRDMEDTIRRGITKWREVGDALAAIRDRKLFRETHATFDAYARDRWGLGKSRAYQLVAAATYAAGQESAGLLVPINEHHARKAKPKKFTRLIGVPETPETVAARLAKTYDHAFLRRLLMEIRKAIA